MIKDVCAFLVPCVGPAAVLAATSHQVLGLGSSLTFSHLQGLRGDSEVFLLLEVSQKPYIYSE